MDQYNFPTPILSGKDALEGLSDLITLHGLRKILIVTDKSLVELGLAERVTSALKNSGAEFYVFDGTHPNPIEEDVTKGTAAYKTEECDGIIALGGGSPMDTAKVIKIMVAHEGPLARYDDAIGGDALIINPMPPVFAIPTTAGTGSEVGRSGVIILKSTGKKTIFFAPSLMPDAAVLEPSLTTGLPPHLTAATGIDAFTHLMEAYFAPGFHPMADGIAVQGMELVIDNLPKVFKNGNNLEARGKMQMAAVMGATAFQKGLGMVHSLAHPLSSHFGIHHGLANALLLPSGIRFLQRQELNEDQKTRIKKVHLLFSSSPYFESALDASVERFISEMGINGTLSDHGISEKNVVSLSHHAFEDPCHNGNMVPVTREDLEKTYREAL